MLLGFVSLTANYVIVFLIAGSLKFRCGELVSIELQPEPPFDLQLSAGHLPVTGLARERSEQ